MAAVIQEDLAKLGIKMQVVPIEFAAVTNAWTRSYEYDAILLGLSVTDLEPSTYANLMLSNGDAHQWRPNQTSPSTEWEAKVDQLFAEQAREPIRKAEVDISRDPANRGRRVACHTDRHAPRCFGRERQSRKLFAEPDVPLLDVERGGAFHQTIKTRSRRRITYSSCSDLMVKSTAFVTLPRIRKT